MAGSVNKVTLIGHLGADPEVRRTQGGNPVVSFSLATSETWRDRTSGERKEKTDWHNIVIWNEGLCKIAEQYLRKGSKVYIEGKLQTRKWQDQNGNDRYSTEVILQFKAELVLLSGRDDDGNGRRGNRRDDDSRRSDRDQPNGGRQVDNGRYSRDLDDDIPF
ncbi:MAG TPA: single-stranded DNA-binding protein [Rhizobium sp.]|nr:single-stranded DNA-binding protein [Rhizobium sp.]